jgi:hypothetical protein
MKPRPPAQLSPWQPHVWISLSSALIALCALALTIYQAYLQRQFQRVSAKPKLLITLYHAKDGVGYYFGNGGLGPLTLKTFEVAVDGKPQRDWGEMCQALGVVPGPDYSYVNPRPGTVIKPDQIRKLFWIDNGPRSEDFFSKSSRISMKACYCSLFDECWQVEERSQPPNRVDSCLTPFSFSPSAVPISSDPQ